MAKFHSLKVADITRETKDAVSIAFDIPANLKQEYTFKQGQYLTLKLTIKGEEVRRSYSICSSPLDHELRIAIKKVKEGKVSTYINDTCKPGDIIEVMVPMGNFFSEMNPNNQKHYVLFAGGSGITPMLSILKTVLQSEPNSRITLLYGNYNQEAIIFNNQITALASTYEQRFKVINLLEVPPSNHPALHTGLMTKEKALALIENYIGLNQQNEFFICGPTPMMDNAMAALKELKIAEEQIHIEYFTTPVSTEEIKVTSATTGSIATIVLDGDEREIQLEDNETILEAAIRVGLDAPYACQGGSCCTCRALLENGKVDMAVNYALSASEVKQGFILTCQSRPSTPNVRVNYDKGL
jgi:ring-1,2-phenylacetyl-CoA epoxidase subunit PaaE